MYENEWIMNMSLIDCRFVVFLNDIDAGAARSDTSAKRWCFNAIWTHDISVGRPNSP